MRWNPHVTVAAIIEQDGKFLLVEEIIKGELKLNQPAGHWEDNESLIDAVVRETLEETAYRFQPNNLVGIYQWQHPASATTYLRFAFSGTLGELTQQALDPDIERAVWLSLDEIKNRSAQHRSPQLLLCIEDYLAGKQFDLDILTRL
jgi:8-oxo-dGTP pyrophosphatase MutT (NUDIX family)